MDVRACAGLVDTTMSEGIVRPTSQDLNLLSFQKRSSYECDLDILFESWFHDVNTGLSGTLLIC